VAESGALVMWRGVADKAEKYVGYGRAICTMQADSSV
jgi:hypothetical protein